MASIFKIALLALAVAVPTSAINCVDDCDPCSAGGKADFIFIIDMSGSMQSSITAVSLGLQNFSQRVASQNLDVVYTIIGTGYSCSTNDPSHEVILNSSPNISLVLDVLQHIKVAQTVVNYNMAHGGFETTFEPMLMAMGLAGWPLPGTGNQTFRNVYPNNVLKFATINVRPDSKVMMFSITDEDDDTFFYPVNVIGDEVRCQECSSTPYLNATTIAPKKQLVIDTVASRLVNANVSVFFFSTGGGCSPMQHGNPDCDTNNVNVPFNASLVLQCLATTASGKSRASLQARMLQLGGSMRMFRINTLISPTGPEYLNSILDIAVAQITECSSKKRGLPQVSAPEDNLFATAPSKRDALQQQPACVVNTCDTNTGNCVSLLKCYSYCEQCLINGVCYSAGASNPNAQCQFCNPELSKTAWSMCNGATTTDNCTKSLCLGNGAYCDWEVPVCTAACNRCAISEIGVSSCVPSGSLRPGGFTCQRCIPSLNDTDWSTTCTCTGDGQCYNGGICIDNSPNGDGTDPIGVCDCAGTGYLPMNCSLKDSDICTPLCQNNGLCQKIANISQCLCLPQNYGDACENTASCDPACANNGVCQWDAPTQSSVCNCIPDSGFGGPSCTAAVSLGTTYCAEKCASLCPDSETGKVGSYQSCVCPRPDAEPIYKCFDAPVVPAKGWVIIVVIIAVIIVVLGVIFAVIYWRRMAMRRYLMEHYGNQKQQQKPSRSNSLRESSRAPRSRSASMSASQQQKKQTDIL